LTTLGEGAMKSAELGYLTLHHVASSFMPARLASPNQAVVVKRPFVLNTEEQKKFRLTPRDEYESILIEANINYWAGSMLSYMYMYAQNMSSTQSAALVLPSMRFVDVGVAMMFGPQLGASSPSRTALIEELIPDDDVGFVKFIGNRNAHPNRFADPRYQNIAEFLSMFQHFVYQKTHGTAYPADLQGNFYFIATIGLICFRFTRVAYRPANFNPPVQCYKLLLFHN
jgi:hypothetical protein